MKYPIESAYSRSINTDDVFISDPDSGRRLKLDGRSDLRSGSFSDALDLYISSPDARPGGAGPSNSDVIFENGMELDVLVHADEATGVADDYISERLKFLPTGEFGLETDVPDQPITLSTENGGGIRFETADGQKNGKHKEPRLVIQGNQNALEPVQFRSTKLVSIRENGTSNDSDSGRLQLGLGDDGTGGALLEFNGQILRLLPPDSGDVIDLMYGDGTIGLRLTSDNDIHLNNSDRLDLKGTVLRGDGGGTRINMDGYPRIYPRSSPPSNPQDGDLTYAKASDWDPGSGTGFYGYENGKWTKL